jgi:hypothetical protein
MKLTVTEAAEVWIQAKELEAQVKADLERTAPVLKAHLRKTGKPFKGRIALNTSSRLQLDTAAVKAELGDRLESFQRRVAIESLALIG